MRGMSEGDRSEHDVVGAETGWDSALYDEKFAIITEFGAGVVELLAPRPGERIVDLGCGTGGLTAQIADGRCRGAGNRRLRGDDRAGQGALPKPPVRGSQG